MAGSAVRNRSEPVTVETPRGPVEVVRQQWRTQQPRGKWRWEWLARRQGQRGWRQGTTAREAIRQAVLLPAGKHSGWLLEAAARATQELEPYFARRQQYRRLSHAGTAAAGSVAAALLALVLASVGAISLAGLLLVAAIGLGFYTRHWLGLAGRSRVGAQSETDVRRALASLEAEGWRLRHGISWQGRGDIDSVAIAPNGIAFAIETKTRSYDDRHLVRVREQAVWLSRRRRRWCRRGALPVLCVVRDRGVQRWEQGALIVSIDRLTSSLRSAAGGLGAPIGQR